MMTHKVNPQRFGPDGLTTGDRRILLEMIARYPEIELVTLFGSRAMGTFGQGSDIDLALEGSHLTRAILARLSADLEESNLPYRVDLLHRDQSLSAAVEKHIRKHGKVFYSARAGLTMELLAEHVDLLIGFPFKSASYTTDLDGIRLVRGDNVVQGRLRWDNAVRWPNHLTEGMERYRLESGDVVLAMDRPWIEAGLKYARIGQDDVPSLLVQRVARLRAAVDLDQGFLYYLVGSCAVTDHVLAIQTGTAVPHISGGQILAFQFSLPPLPEQRAIASVLGSLDDKIEQNRRTARELERLARAIFRAWFVDFEPVKAKAAGATSFPSMPRQVFDALPTHLVDSEIGPVPEGWEMKTIGDVVTVKGGATPSTKKPEYWEGGVHCWATPKDMSRLLHPVLLDTDRHITDAGVACINSGLLPEGSVLLSSRAPVGYLAIAAVLTAINQGFISMVCDGPLPSSYILNWAFQSLDAIKARASGTTFPEISKKNFRPLHVVVPPSAVVGAFTKLANPLFDLMTACVKENARLAKMRGYLLPKLLSGEVRVDGREEIC
ncbi:MAG: restriction endonuclease subunit S [Burkholderiales bacterium]